MIRAEASSRIAASLEHAPLPDARTSFRPSRTGVSVRALHDDSEGDDVVRRGFARLMPNDPVLVDQFVESLAHSFDVSSQAVRIRLNEIELLPPRSLS